MDFQPNRHVVFVVGGSGFIGEAIVNRTTAEGATAIVATRSTPSGSPLDANDDESVAATIATIINGYGRLDSVVISAAKRSIQLSIAILHRSRWPSTRRPWPFSE